MQHLTGGLDNVQCQTKKWKIIPFECFQIVYLLADVVKEALIEMVLLDNVPRWFVVEQPHISFQLYLFI